VIDVEQMQGRQSVEGSATTRRKAARYLGAAALAAALAAPAAAQQMAIPGSFAVSASGAATYEIAIAVPPGTAGMVPALKFSYSSQGIGNGLLGVGWSLSGLPSIGRCAQTVAQDGAHGAITFTTTDRFCMDGQRLIAVSGTYGADGAQYRTEIDAFSQIISHGTAGTGPAWFEVHTKAGQIMQFGNTTDSLVLAQGKTSARNWALNKVSDTKGNYLTVTYVNDVVNGQAYPREIDYTGNTAASVAPYNKVTFSYATRPDPSSLYQAGSLIGSTVRLTDVMTYSGGALVADYQLTYQQSVATLASEVNSIKVCASDSTCMPATTVNWLSGFAGTFTVNTQANAFGGANFGSPAQSLFLPISGDFNGDGKTDWMMIDGTTQRVFLSNGDATFTEVQTANAFGAGLFGLGYWSFGSPPQSAYLPITGDFDGDGKTDWMMIADTFQFVFFSNGDGTFREVMNLNAFGGLNFGSPPSSTFLPISGDFDGDGRTDWLMVHGPNLFVFISKGDGTFTIIPTANAFGGLDFGTPPQSQFLPISGDFDGDGRTDWLMVHGPNLFVFISKGDGTFAITQTGNAFGGLDFGSPPQAQYLSVVGDFNGDGKTDWSMIAGTTLRVFISNGDASFTKVETDSAFGGSNLGSPPDSQFETITGDFNADGKVDWMMIGGANQRVFLGNGSGLLIANTFSGNAFGGANFGTPPAASFLILSGDYDGDGKTDWLVVNGTTLRVFLANGPAADFVQSITTGLGATTTITHVPLTNSGAYTKDATAVYPVQDLQGPMYVVSRIDSANGKGGIYSSTYSYAGAKSDLSGRGFLGFRQMAITDLQIGIVHTTTYSQIFPYLGLTTAETKALGTLTLNQANSIYQVNNAGGGTTISTPSNTNAPYQVSVSQTMAQSWDLDGTAMPTSATIYQYDSYGNPTNMTLTSDRLIQAVTNTYSNDTTNWFLGRLTNTTVQSVTVVHP
jgi:hypothetical protein